MLKTGQNANQKPSEALTKFWVRKRQQTWSVLWLWHLAQPSRLLRAPATLAFPRWHRCVFIPPLDLCKCYFLCLEHSHWPSTIQVSFNRWLWYIFPSSSQVLLLTAVPHFQSIGAHGSVHILLDSIPWCPRSQWRTDVFYGIVLHPFCLLAVWQSPVWPSLNRELDGLTRNTSGCMAQAPKAKYIPTSGRMSFPTFGVRPGRAKDPLWKHIVEENIGLGAKQA